MTEDIVVAGDFVYAAGDAGVRIIDLADPAQPQIVSSYGTPGRALGLDLVGSRLYVADGTDTRVFPYRVGAGLLILDVSAPAAPLELGRFPTPGIASAVEVAGSRAYLVDDSLNIVSAGLRILDVSTPATPSEVGSLVGFSTIHDGDLQLPLVFGASAYGFGIADVANPAAPELRVVLPIPTSAVHAVGNLAYVASGFFPWDTGPALRLYDVSQPAAPALLGEALSVQLDGAGRDVAVVGTTVYLLTSRQLIILDATNPAQPAVRKRIALPWYQFVPQEGGAIALRGDLVLVGGDTLAVLRVDLNLPDCSDALDNDGDGRIDAGDSGCTDASDFSEQAACFDGVDSDGDGLVDLADPGCKDANDPSERSDCGDGTDNDGDGQIDLSDPGCDSDEDLSEQSDALVCDNGLDDDGDGRIDFHGASPDPGCLTLVDPSEQDATLICDNGLDDDGDGGADFRTGCLGTSSCDPGCADFQDASELDPAVACDDGIDNDGDTAIDHPADVGCGSRTDHSEGELVVNSGADTLDAIPGDGLCADASGACTLRAAVDESNALLGPDAVVLPAGAFVLERGSLTIVDDAVLAGAGADTTVIDAAGTDTALVIGIDPFEMGPRVRIRDLAITGGETRSSTSFFFRGGGITSFNTDLELDGVWVHDNGVGPEAFPFGAGGLFQHGGHLRILRSTIADNTGASLPGYGIYSAGGLESVGDCVQSKAGCYCPPTPTTSLAVVNSTIGDNVGGGLGIGRSGPFYWGCGMNVDISASTIAWNDGPGLSVGSGSSVVDLRSSIVARQESGADCVLPASLTISAGHNLDSDGSCHLTNPTDLPGQDPRLGPLGWYGGPTPTRTLLQGSPALDAIPVAVCGLTADQRSTARPQGPACDVGAVELDPTSDADGDGVADGLDDCPLVADPGQEDTGGIGLDSSADGIGDACQCGDVSGDGRVTLADAAVITRSLLVPPTATAARPNLCDVGGPREPGAPRCSLVDAVIVRRALLAPATATVQQACADALP